MSVEVLVLEDRPERLSARVVIARSGLSHRSPNIVSKTELSDSAIGELAAAVRMPFNASSCIFAEAKGLSEGRKNDVCCHVSINTEPEDAS